MKSLAAFLVLTFTSVVVLAHPGGHHLVCKSAKSSGSKQALEIDLNRSNGVGWYNPEISVKVNGQSMAMTTPDVMNSYGDTFHDSPLGVIIINVDNSQEKNVAVEGYFSVVAIPSTVHALDEDGKPVKWNLKSEKDECSDSNGKATFQGVIHGSVQSGKSSFDMDPQILDCELTYDSGMAC